MRLAQRHLRPLALGDIVECDDHADDRAVFANRGAHVLDRETRPILPPQHPIADAKHRPCGQRCKEGSGLPRMGGSVWLRMAQYGVDQSTEELLDGIPRHMPGGRIYDYSVSLPVQPINPLTRRA